MRGLRSSSGAALLLLGIAMVGCGGKASKARTTPGATPAPASTVRIGDCADPERDGVVGGAPDMRRADRDLNGDQVNEAVVADRTLCTEEGNCHWNVFVPDPAAGCSRYAGTIAGRAIEPLTLRGEGGFYGLRGWWAFGDGRRMLMQEYRFRHGGYHVRDAVVCRQVDDDRLICQVRAGE